MNRIKRIIQSIIAAGQFAIYQKEVLVLESIFQGIRTDGVTRMSTLFSTGTFDLTLSRIGSGSFPVNQKNLSGFEFMERPDKTNKQYLFIARVHESVSENKSPILGITIYFNIELQKYVFEIVKTYLDQKEVWGGGDFAVHGSSGVVFLKFQEEFEKIASEIEKKKAA